jgi:hypothetical protein
MFFSSENLCTNIIWQDVHAKFLFWIFWHFKICFSVIGSFTPVSRNGYPSSSLPLCKLSNYCNCACIVYHLYSTDDQHNTKSQTVHLIRKKNRWRFGARSRFIKKLKKIFLSLKKISACSQLFIPPTCKKSCSNTLYFGLHKNDKRLDLSRYTSNL